MPSLNLNYSDQGVFLFDNTTYAKQDELMRGIYDSQYSLGLASLFDSSDKNQTYKPKDGGLGITVLPPPK